MMKKFMRFTGSVFTTSFSTGEETTIPIEAIKKLEY